MTVYVVDILSPEIECSNVTVIAADGLMPDLTNMINVTDNCGVTNITQNVTVNTRLQVGDHEVLVTVTDAGGNRFEIL